MVKIYRIYFFILKLLRERIERPSLLLHNSALTTKLSELKLNKKNFFNPAALDYSKMFTGYNPGSPPGSTAKLYPYSLTCHEVYIPHDRKWNTGRTQPVFPSVYIEDDRKGKQVFLWRSLLSNGPREKG